MIRGAAVFCGVVLTGALLAPGATAAEEAPVRAKDAGWYTRQVASDGPVELGDPIANSTVRQGDLPVGTDGASEDTRAYLLLEIPSGARDGELLLPVSDSPGVNYGVPGPIILCLVAGPFEVTNGGSLADAPEVDCSADIRGLPVENDGGATVTQSHWSFPLGPLLQMSPDRDLPVAFVADTRVSQPAFQIAFQAEFGAEVGTVQVEAAAAGSDNPDAQQEPVPVAQPEHTEANRDADGPPALTVEAFEPGPPVPFGGQPSPAPPAETPVVAAPANELSGDVAPIASRRIAGARPAHPLLWSMGVIGAAALVLTGRALGQPGDPVSELDQLLARP